MSNDRYNNKKVANTRKKKCKWVEDKTNTFINPYNFISLGTECEKKNWDNHLQESELLTGFINCQLQTKTSVFIPNTSNNHAFTPEVANIIGKDKTKDITDIYSYDFFSYTDLSRLGENKSSQPEEPIIPASEIRGVIRSVFEVVTDSCLSTNEKSCTLYKRTPVPGNYGFLMKYPREHDKHGKYYIQAAEKVMLKTKECSKDTSYSDNHGNDYANIDDYTECETVLIEKSKDHYDNKPFMPCTVTYISKQGEVKPDKKVVEGYIHKAGPISKKHHESVFIKKEFNKDTSLPDLDKSDIERLKDLIRLYDPMEKINTTDKHIGYNYYGDLLETDFHLLPVYYACHNKICYISPSCISKEVFKESLGNILGQFKPCCDINELCTACRMFGMVGENIALGSRIRFTDGVIIEKCDNPADYYDGLKVLPELSSPKISATEFYLKRPDFSASSCKTSVLKPDKKAHVWNYDYAFLWSDENKQRPVYLENYRARIRGRKFYWHAKTPNYWNYEDPDAKLYLNKRSNLVRVLNSNINFSFKVYFEDITIDELRKLVYSLNLGNNNNEHCHKIGHGKPAGLGSIKICVNDIKVRHLSIENGSIKYELVDYYIEEPEKAIDIGKTNIKELLAITNFAKCPKHIKYPLAFNKTETDPAKKNAVYQWFIGNRQMGNGVAQKPIVAYKLPDILDDSGNFNITNVKLPKLICE